MKANDFIKKFGLGEAKVLIAKHEKCYMPHVFDMWSDELQDFVLVEKYASFDMIDLKRLVESHELVDELGGFEKAKLHLVATDKRLGYTHVYLHENGRYCWLDDYIDHIPFCAISIDSVTKAITDVESVESLKEMT